MITGGQKGQDEAERSCLSTVLYIIGSSGFSGVRKRRSIPKDGSWVDGLPGCIARGEYLAFSHSTERKK
jgi:hypothetical protein